MASEFQETMERLFKEALDEAASGPKANTPLAMREVVKGWFTKIEETFGPNEFEENVATVLAPIKEGASENPEEETTELVWQMEQLLEERRNLKRIVRGAVDAMAPFQGQIPNAAPILQGALLEALIAEIAALPPEQRSERIESIKARSAENQRRNEEFAKEIEAKEQAWQQARIAKEEEWRRRSFRWLLFPVPGWDERTEEVKATFPPFSTEEVEAIRAVAFSWEASDQRQKLHACLFDHFSHLNADWESIVRWENGLALAFLYEREPPSGAINVW